MSDRVIQERNPFHDTMGLFTDKGAAKTVSFSMSGPHRVALGKKKDGSTRYAMVTIPTAVRFRPSRNVLSLGKERADCGRFARSMGTDVRCHDGKVMSAGPFGLIKDTLGVGTSKDKASQMESVTDRLILPLMESDEDVLWMTDPEDMSFQTAEVADGAAELLVVNGADVDEDGTSGWGYFVFGDDTDEPVASGEVDNEADAKMLAVKAAWSILASRGFIADHHVMESIQNGEKISDILVPIFAR